MNDTSKLVIILGSVREARFGSTVSSWVADQARAHGGFEVETIDLAEIDLPLALPAVSPKAAGADYPRPAGMAPLTSALDGADAIILVTPEYNRSFPAALKAAIDWHFTQWTAKPVAVVSYGAAGGGRHAATQLENVLTELHAVPIQARLSFIKAIYSWQDGRPLDEDSAGFAKAMLNQLDWWAGALRSARAAAPYPV